MPWHVDKSSSCPVSKPWAVIKDSDSSVVGCHATKKDADKQLAALNINVDSKDLDVTTVSRVLQRSVDFELRELTDGETDGLTLSGHAAVFNQETQIDSWEGRFIETIAPGAFRKTIRERTPVLQFEHGRHPLIGSIPIGRIDNLQEDNQGLFVEGRLTDNWLMQPVRDAIRDRTITGMSFRFEAVKEIWEDNSGKQIRDPNELMRIMWDPSSERGPVKRTLKEVKVHELGPVVFPAYEGTSVDMRASEAATKVYADKDLLQSIRSSLALGWQSHVTAQDGLEKDLAKAILFDRYVVAEPVPTVESHTDISRTIAEQMAKQLGQFERTFAASSSEEISGEEKEDKPLRDEHSSSEKVTAGFKDSLSTSLRRMNRILGSISEGKYE